MADTTLAEAGPTQTLTVRVPEAVSSSLQGEVKRVAIVDGWLVLTFARGLVVAWPDHIVRGWVSIDMEET